MFQLKPKYNVVKMDCACLDLHIYKCFNLTECFGLLEEVHLCAQCATLGRCHFNNKWQKPNRSKNEYIWAAVFKLYPVDFEKGVSYCTVSGAILMYSLDIQHSSKVTRTLVTAIQAEMSPIFGSWLTLRVQSQGWQLWGWVPSVFGLRLCQALVKGLVGLSSMCLGALLLDQRAAEQPGPDGSQPSHPHALAWQPQPCMPRLHPVNASCQARHVV